MLFHRIVELLFRFLTYFIATPPYRGWQRNEGLLLLHSFLSLFELQCVCLPISTSSSACVSSTVLQSCTTKKKKEKKKTKTDLFGHRTALFPRVERHFCYLHNRMAYGRSVTVPRPFGGTTPYLS